MLRYSKRAIHALSFLFRPYNDIDVYVEDTTCRNAYEVLINRIVKGDATVSRVFQLGSRDRVIEECEKQQGNFTRPCLFIIDGDFDQALGVSGPAMERLYRLNAYCWENILFCRTAISRVAYDSLSNSSTQEVEGALSLTVFVERLDRSLRNLFVVYSIARSLDESIETAGCHVYTMCVQREGQPTLDHRKVRSKRRAILRQLRACHSAECILGTYRGIRKRMNRGGITFRHLVSGKTYLLGSPPN